jgi:hypothetical protein
VSATIRTIERKEAELNKIRQESQQLLEEKKLLEQRSIELEQSNEQLKKQLEAKAQVRVASAKTSKSGYSDWYTGNCFTAIRNNWPAELYQVAQAVVRAESGGHPGRISSTNDHGCFQLNKGYASWGRAVYDADFNAKQAYRMYQSRGWQPWTAYKNGAYRRFL